MANISTSARIKESLVSEGYKVIGSAANRFVIYGIDLDELVDALKILDVYDDVKRLEKLSNTSARVVFY